MHSMDHEGGEAMAVSSGVHDILEVFTVVNLPALATFNPILRVPAGLTPFIDTETVDKLNSINLAADYRELLVNYVLVRQLRSI